MTTQNFFNDNTWANAVPSCTRADMADDFIDRLNLARSISHPQVYVINSAYRTREHEISRRRTGNGPHTTGRAVDIRARNSRERDAILRGLYAAGFHRIGVNFQSNFIHVDDSHDHDPNVFFPY